MKLSLKELLNQVSRLSELMNEVVPIHGRGNFPTLEVVMNTITIFNVLIYIEIMMKMIIIIFF